ncbi:cullin [Syncephalis pseudoplumigaleata]|uniref:Cullin-4 n=1 Tax=Syncephalis pseudoplumigaleata TaxID=1712513 RepID=A0A4P9YWN1_9FUNG|nr:cullin [Syncephalis pseudoplumigaleata]|eukprot:RKP24523.1 cullin [Syncephalis pseudoplumigaleata]
MSSHGGGGSAPGRDPETGRASAANQRRLPSTGGSVAVARSGQARKLIVKNFKDKPKLPDNFERDSWRKLQAAIVAIYEQTKVTESLEELYRVCESMCYHKLADKLYGYLLAESERHVTTIAQRLSTYQGDSASFLEQIHQEWVNYCRHIKIRSVFLYLDRTYVLRTPSVAPIWKIEQSLEMHLNLFCSHILNQQSIGPLVLTGLLKLIEQERQGETIDRPLVKTLVDMYRDLSLYTSHFEAPFLHASAVFYEAEGKRLLDSLSTSAYLVHCEQRLHEEQERLQLYLDEEKTRDKLVQVVEKGLISCNMQHLLDTGFSDLIANERVDDLSRLYSLCKRVDMLDALRAALAKHIKAQGMAIVSDADHDDQMVTRLLALKQQIDTVHSKAFEHAQAFGHTIIESFESFINSRANKPAEMIGRWRGRSKRRAFAYTASDEELEARLEQILVLFRFIEGSDIFEAFYKRDFAKRLLLNKSASSDLEKSMLAKLRTECGPGFTSKLEGMFKDMDVSRDLAGVFRQSKWARPFRDVDLGVNVLTHGIWPTYHPMDVILPPIMAEYQDAFKQFYNSQHKNRVLTWQHSLGHCRLRAYFPKGTKELQVSLLQAIVLLLFNDCAIDGSLSYRDIHKKTGIAPDELQRTLLSLSCGKSRVLLKSSRGPTIDEDNDQFKFNAKFQAELVRIKINSIQMKETIKENEETKERVFQDRQFQVDAAIVRIMKARKRMSHVNLSAEIYEQLKFHIPPRDLQKRIESLIERDYLERDAEESNVYKYLA